MRRGAWQVGLGVLALGLMTSRGLAVGDAAVHLDVAASIVERGETALSLDPGALWVPSAPRAGGLIHQDGEVLRSASSPGLAVLAAPLFSIGAALSGGPPVGALVRPFFAAEPGPLRAWLRPIQRDPRVVAFALLGPLAAALTAAFLWLAASALGLSRRARILATAALVLGSPLLAYAGTSWTQLPTAAALAFALHRTAARTRAQVAAWPLGLALALAVFVRPDHVVFAVPFAAAWLVSEGIGDARRAATARTPEGGGASDAALGRRPPTGLGPARARPRVVARRRGGAPPTELGAARARPPVGARRRGRALGAILGPPIVVLAALAAWGVPLSGDGWSLARLPEGALGLLASPRTGLLPFAPFVVFVPWAFVRGTPGRDSAAPAAAPERPAENPAENLAENLAEDPVEDPAEDAEDPADAVSHVGRAAPPPRATAAPDVRSAARRMVAGLALGLGAAALALYGGWFDWPASLAYGPRFLVPILAPLALAFGVAVDALPPRARGLAGVAVALGVAVQLPGALVLHARIDEADAFAHPTALSAWRALLTGDAVGAGVDCAATYVVAYPALALAAALLGLAVSREARERRGRAA